MTLYERTSKDIDGGLVGYWKFDDLKLSGASSIIDFKNFNDGTINGDPLAQANHRGTSDEAVFFDGNGDYMSLSNPTALKLGDTPTTIAFWAKLFNTQDGYIYSSRDGSLGELSLLVSSGTLFAYIGTTATDSTSNSNVVDATWTHYAIVYDKENSEVRYYVDGLLNKTGTTISSFDTSVNKAMMARADGTEDLRSSLGPFRIYNRALSHGEISKLHRFKK